MRKTIPKASIFLLLISIIYASCQSNISETEIAADSLSINKGQIIFNQHCNGCHNFKQDGIGPNLSGLTGITSVNWIKKFIVDPNHLIQSGDTRAQQLFTKYQTVMPSFDSFSKEEMNNLISYLHSHKTVNKSVSKDPDILHNPIPLPIPVSDIVLSLREVCQVPPSANKPPRARIVKMDVQPTTQNLFLLDLRGKLYRFKNDTPEVYMNMAELKPDFIHQPGLGTGFGSFAFHPEFFANGLLYTTHTEPAKTKKADFVFHDSIKVTLQWVITEWKTNQPSADVFSGQPRELMRINMLVALHGVQDIAFNPHSKTGDEDYGHLFIGVGDGGSVENGHPEFVRSPDKIWGTIMRINPLGNNSANKQYGFSKSNPILNNNKPTEIFAKGFRNPNRITWLQTGEMLATNIGHGNIESVNFIFKGHDYGWPIREGTFAIPEGKKLNEIYHLPANDSVNQFTYPVIQYDHDEGKAIAGGYEYLGKEVPALKGKYLFGDIVTGRLFFSETIEMKPGKQASIKEWRLTVNGRRTTLRELCGNHRVDLRLGRDHKGEMYVFTKADGKVYRISASEDLMTDKK